MPKRKADNAAWSREVPLAWTSFRVPTLINNRNAVSSLLKSDAQSWQSRAASAVPGTDILAPASPKKAHTRSQNGSESENEEEEPRSLAHDTIVIHLGSEFLRIGRASSLGPLTYPNVIARRCGPPHNTWRERDVGGQLNGQMPVDAGETTTGTSNTHDAEGSTPVPSSQLQDLLGERVETLRQDLRSIMRVMKLRAVPQGRQLAQSYNESAKGEAVEHDPDEALAPWTTYDKSVYIGEQALRLPYLSLPDPARSEKKDANLTSEQPWRLFHPFKRGMLNLDEYASLYGDAAEQVVLGDIQTIVEMILSAPEGEADDGSLTGLGIERARWASLSITLIVPDLFSRRHLRLLADLLLSTMGFAGLTLQCEAVSSCFGAGVSSGTVINLGAETTCISCVDEGVLVPESRILINYGGRDVSRFLSELLRRAKMPYAVGDSPGPLRYDERQADRMAVDQLKARFCTLWPNDIGLNMYDMVIRLPSEARYKFLFRMYDETILAPLMLFLPRVVDFDAKQGPRTPRRVLPGTEKISLAAPLSTAVEDPTDPYGSEPDTAVTNAMLFAVRHLVPSAAASRAGSPPVQPEEPIPEGASPLPVSTNAATPAPEGTPAPGATPGLTPAPAIISTTPTASGAPAATDVPASPPGPTLVPSATPLQANGVDVAWEASKTPLDISVWASIVGAASTLLGGSSVEDRVKKMAANILCVGGTAHLPGLAAALEARVATHIEAQFQTLAQEREVAFHPTAHVPGGVSPQVAKLSTPTAQAVPVPRDMDPAHVAWKGAAVMSRLDTIVAETRVRRQEWQVLNWRAVRDRTLFL